MLSLHIIPSCHSCHSDLQLYIWRCLLWDNPGSTEESRQSPPPHQPAAGPGRAQVRGRQDSGQAQDIRDGGSRGSGSDKETGSGLNRMRSDEINRRNADITF